MQRPPLCRAFLLWEVLIASAVFAIAVTGLAVALNRLIEARQLAAREQRLRTELESRLALARVDPELQPDTRLVDRDAEGIEYTRTVEEVRFENGDKDAVEGIWRVNLNARRGDEDLGTVSLLLYRP